LNISHNTVVSVLGYATKPMFTHSSGTTKKHTLHPDMCYRWANWTGTDFSL